MFENSCVRPLKVNIVFQSDDEVIVLMFNLKGHCVGFSRLCLLRILRISITGMIFVPEWSSFHQFSCVLDHVSSWAWSSVYVHLSSLWCCWTSELLDLLTLCAHVLQCDLSSDILCLSPLPGTAACACTCCQTRRASGRHWIWIVSVCVVCYNVHTDLLKLIC